jgi:hypothetical protein
VSGEGPDRASGPSPVSVVDAEPIYAGQARAFALSCANSASEIAPDL